RQKSGDTSGLTYYWDFGDGSPVVSTTNPVIQHTFPTQAAWRDVKLLVQGSGNSSTRYGSYRPVEPIDFFPPYYPPLAPPPEPAPPSSGPPADPCGALSQSEQQALIDASKHAQPSTAPTPSLASIASYGLKP